MFIVFLSVRLTKVLTDVQHFPTGNVYISNKITMTKSKVIIIKSLSDNENCGKIQSDMTTISNVCIELEMPLDTARSHTDRQPGSRLYPQRGRGLIAVRRRLPALSSARVSSSCPPPSSPGEPRSAGRPEG